MNASHPEFKASLVGDLVAPTPPIMPDISVGDILDAFRANPRLQSMPLLDADGRFAGLLYRRAFLDFVSQSYALDLYARKPLSTLLTHKPELANAELCLDAAWQTDRGVKTWLLGDPEMRKDTLPVMRDGRFVGIVAVADLMLNLSESQGRLIEAMQTLGARLHEEVAHAAVLQRNLLPPSRVALPGVRGHAVLLTSTEVGGDYYDYYCVEDRWTVLLIGDVSGHGVASGVLVSAAKACVTLLAGERERDPGKILARLNEAILKLAHRQLLMTLFAACLDTHTGELAYANAAHQFPYLLRYALDSLEMLELGGLPLGKSPDTRYAARAVQLDIGDKLFFYTDGAIEEENGAAVAFGYERLEGFLKLHSGLQPETLCHRFCDALRAYAGRHAFSDDVTLFCIEFHERRISASTDAHTRAWDKDLDIVRIAESFYRANPQRLMPRLSRQNMVFLAEGQFVDLLPRLTGDGIRRVLPRYQAGLRRLGWKKLLSQHLRPFGRDIDAFLPEPEFGRIFNIRRSEEKESVIAETADWLASCGLEDTDRLDATLVLLDEMLDNGLYAAPRDGRGKPIYAKGAPRVLGKDETLRLSLALQDGWLGLHAFDSWGTLTPAIFLERLARHAQGAGVQAGRGGSGLYLMWRMSDYLQLRVHPRHGTQATVLLDLSVPVDAEKANGFQFLFHAEIQENLNHEPFDIAYLPLPGSAG